jgi:hypothetical protein
MSSAQHFQHLIKSCTKHKCKDTYSMTGYGKHFLIFMVIAIYVNESNVLQTTRRPPIN